MSVPDLSSVLVGRDADVAFLHRRLAGVATTGAALVLVSGPAGSGTSAVVRRLVDDHVAAGGRCLQARAVPWEQELRHGVLSQLVGESTVAGDVLGAATALVDHVATAPGGEPALVVVDDASWSDVESLQALSTTVRHHRRAPLLVVLAATHGPGTGSPPATATLDRIQDRIELGPLGPTEIQALASDRGIVLSHALAARLGRFTGGRPGPITALFTEMPGGTWLDHDTELPAPRAVTADVRRRLLALSPPGRAVAEVVAVLGRAPWSGVTRLVDVDDPLVVLDEVATAGLVTALQARGTTETTPSDPMTQSAILAALGRARVSALHRAAAEVVGNRADRLLHLVAAATGPDPRLAEELEDLAAERATTGEWASVAELLTSSARLTVDTRLAEERLTRAFDAVVGSGDTMAASVRVDEIESLRETPLRNAALGYLAILLGRPAEAESRLTRAWELVNAERDPDTAAMICQRFVLHSLARCRGQELVMWADRALAMADAGSPAAVETAAIRGLGLAAVGQGHEALASQVRMEETIRHGAQAQRVAMGRGWLHLVLDEVDEARAALTSATSTGFLGGSARISLWAHAWLARALFVSGEWDDALDVADRGSHIAEQTGVRLLQPLMAWTRAQIHALRGDWAAAKAAVRDTEAGPRDYEMMRVAGCLARAGVAEAKGDYAAVIRALAPLRQRWAGGDIDEPGSWPWADVCANALVVEGHYEEADAFLRPHEEVALARDHRSARARLSSARGRLLGATGDLPSARTAFEEAVALLDDLPLPYDRARVHFAWGQTLRRAGKRREADVALRTARDLYEGLGATAYVERCNRELRAGGVRPAGSGSGARRPEALTPQEELVTALVARGLTNRAVASELFISTKTVQYHLTRIYSKLGIRSRGELAALRGSTPGQP